MSRLLVHFHVYYDDQIPFFLGKMGNISGCDWDLYVTYSNLSGEAREIILSAVPGARFLEVENVGYDIWPFVRLLRTIDLDCYDYVLKLHTKSASRIRTKWRGVYLDGDIWRDRLVDALLMDKDRFASLISSFGKDSSAGLFCHRLFLVEPSGPLPEDGPALSAELSRIGLEASDRHFCAGTIFLARMAPFKLIRDADITREMFSSEMASHGCGSLAHVYERILSIAVSASGFRLVPQNTPPFREIAKIWYRDILEFIFSLRRDGLTDTKYLTLFGIKIPLSKGRRTVSSGRNYLVVALDVSLTAPGIVFKTLLRSLSESCGITLLAQNIDESILNENIHYIPLKHGIEYWGRAEKKWRRFGFNPRDLFWTWKTWLCKHKEITRYRYDSLITLTSNGYYSSLNLGRLLARRFRLKYIIYSVDGMPSPVEWMNGDRKLHRKLSGGIAALCSRADIFVLSNPMMIEYEKSVMPRFKGTWDYLFTPYRPLSESFERVPHDGFNLLYAGSLYGLRRIDSLVEAFRRFLTIRPDATLYFVGERAPGYEKFAGELLESGRIVFREPTDRIDEYYAKADCLIDLAADIPDDVFLSSKVICYLPYKIPILAISGENSPVSQIMKDVPSIVQCRNYDDGIYEALLRALEVKDFSDRMELLEAFKPDSICRKFKAILES